MNWRCVNWWLFSIEWCWMAFNWSFCKSGWHLFTSFLLGFWWFLMSFFDLTSLFGWQFVEFWLCGWKASIVLHSILLCSERNMHVGHVSKCYWSFLIRCRFVVLKSDVVRVRPKVICTSGQLLQVLPGVQIPGKRRWQWATRVKRRCFQ